MSELIDIESLELEKSKDGLYTTYFAKIIIAAQCSVLTEHGEKPDIVKHIKDNIHHSLKTSLIRNGINQLLLEPEHTWIDPLVDTKIIENPHVPDGRPITLFHPSEFAKRMQEQSFAFRLTKEGDK